MTHDGGRTVILAIDSATTDVVIATGTIDGTVDRDSSWPAGHRHGETLLPAIERALTEQGIDRSDLCAVVVGTGPGAFTGLRVGIATAKGIAHGLDIPLVGVSTAEALLSAANAAGAGPQSALVLLLPAGPSDRVVVRSGAQPDLLRGGVDPELSAGEIVVAVDLAGRAPEDAGRRGEAAHAGLGAALLRLGAAALPVSESTLDGTMPGAAIDHEALARIVPEYVTLPRGVRSSTGSIEWSRGPR
jgi:tRNA threonylcarbamoyl adenosine modification protein YeaZ